MRQRRPSRSLKPLPSPEHFEKSEAELSGKARRTLSFLKIHVECDEEQLAMLEAISAAMPSVRRKSKASTDGTSDTGEPRKRHPRKSKDSVETGSEPVPNPDGAFEAVTEKGVPSSGDPSGPGSDEPSAAPKPDKKKTGSKSAAIE